MIPYDAVLFDLDGVLTDTAALHAACWKRTFDEVLDEPFDVNHDYVAHVDGKSRHDGVRAMLRARGVEPDDATVEAIADRKQALVEAALAEGGAEAFPGSVAWVRELRRAGLRTAVVSLAVVATGNHYVVDIAAGLLVAAAGYLVGRLPRRLPTLLPSPRLALSGEPA